MAKPTKSTQEFIPIREIRDGLVVLKDGTIAMVLIASSLNFALKSEDEQRATLAQYQNFLNSLDFSIQFYIQSRRLDIRPYLALLEERLKEQVNDLMKIQTREYVKFIRSFTESVSIMTKSFFIVVPYSPSIIEKSGSSKVGIFARFLGRGRSPATVKVDKTPDHLDEFRTQLEQRASVVAQGMARTGVRVVALGTEELVELFYKIFNPGELERPVLSK
jgi:hypothetical protein